MSSIASTNPATGEVVRTFAALTEPELEARLAKAAAAARGWRERPLAARTAVVRRAGELLEARKDRYGALMTFEMGKLRKAAVAEVEKCAAGCSYFAESAAAHLADEAVESDAKRSFKRFQPLGAVLAVMPWNFPFWQVFRFAAPALCAGNVGLLKHASNVPQCALAIEEVFLDAGAPEGVFQTLLLPASRIAKLVEDPRVHAATLTGSEGAGRSLARACGEHLKKTVLELGGSDPFLILPSADLDAAVSTAVRARVQNAGQSCIAAKRFLVHDRIADAFEERFVAAMRALRMGDPSDDASEVGPLASRQVRDDVHAQVGKSHGEGARIACGGAIPDRPGFWYPPTVLLGAQNTTAFREEVFGPVAAVARVRDLDHAIALANDTPFGLGASAFTRDAAEAERLATALDAGNVFINGMVKSDPRLPFGGVKASGYGRELSREGIREFVNVKTVWMG